MAGGCQQNSWKLKLTLLTPITPPFANSKQVPPFLGDQACTHPGEIRRGYPRASALLSPCLENSPPPLAPSSCFYLCLVTQQICSGPRAGETSSLLTLEQNLPFGEQQRWLWLCVGRLMASCITQRAPAHPGLLLCRVRGEANRKLMPS